MIRKWEVGEIISFPVWMIPFPVSKNDYELFESNEKHFVEEDIWPEGLEVQGIIPFPVWMIPFPVLNI